MEKVSTIEQSFKKIMENTHLLSAYILDMSESNLHKNLNSQGWTIRHLVSYILSINDILLEISQSSNQQLTHLSQPAVIRKAIGMKMLTFFSLRKIEIVTFLQNKEQFNLISSNLNNNNAQLYHLENQKNLKYLEKLITKNSDKIDTLMNHLKKLK
ncbi:MAG: hypothetical protein P8J51_04895 [Dehalococcoidia bacterium]|nr:hypothetical protein [Dehalococcoidia bacterium]